MKYVMFSILILSLSAACNSKEKSSSKPFIDVQGHRGCRGLMPENSLAAFQIIIGLIVLSMYHSFFILFGLVLIALVYTILVFSGPRGLKSSLIESKHKYDVAYWLVLDQS